MKQVSASVISNEELWGEFRPYGHLKYSGAWLIRLRCPEVALEAKPGQFVMVSCGEECILPRPFSIHQVNDKGVALFYAVLVDGKGTNWLSRRQAGDAVGLFGPLGNGYSIHPDSHNLLLLAGGNGIAPLCFLAEDALSSGHSVKLLYGTVNEDRYQVASEIDVVAVTEDGSVGEEGMVTDLIADYIDWADQVFACGPVPMYRAMAETPALGGKSVQISLEVTMGCGRGVCYGCTLKTKQGLKLCCQDGPVFELDEILWDQSGY